MRKRVAVIGIGNVGLYDDGVGPYVIEALAQEEWSSGIELVDIGAACYELDGYLFQKDYVVLIQALRVGFLPGHVFCLGHEELLRVSREACRASAPTFYILGLADRLGFLPREITFIGIEPRKICPGFGLSRELHTAVRKVVNLVKKNLKIRGYISGTEQVVPLTRYRLNLLEITI